MNERNEEDSAVNEIEQLLKQLAVEARQQPPQSHQRQLALTRLVNTILQSNRLARPQRGAWMPHLYEDFYNEALQKTFLEICQKIDNYNSNHPVMAWVNFHLKIKFVDVVNEHKKKGMTGIPRAKKNQIGYIPSLDNLEKYLSTEETLSDAQLLKQFLEDDPENLFKTERLRKHPEVTFQLVSIAKFVEERTWEEIATSLNISVQTLNSFFYRRLHKLTAYFEKYLQE